MLTFSVCATLLAGFVVSIRSQYQTCGTALRSEMIGGGLLATGLVLLGAGLQRFVDF